MKLIQDRSNSAAEAQEAPDIHGHAGNISSGWPPASSSTSVVRLASRTSSNGRAAHVSSSSPFSSIRDRSDRGLNETGGRRPEQRAARPAACPHRRVASPGETHAFAVFPQDPGVTVRVRDVLRMRHHPSDSSVGQVACADPSPLCAENRTPMADKCPPSIDLGSSGLLGSPSLSQKYGAIRDA